jgi:hypothetical protein
MFLIQNIDFPGEFQTEIEVQAVDDLVIIELRKMPNRESSKTLHHELSAVEARALAHALLAMVEKPPVRLSERGES